MEAKELRIGNLVMSNGIIENENEPYILTVETIHPKNVKFNEINWLMGNMITFDKFKPIPLTEEWLKRFGWIWNEETKSFEKYPNGDVRMHLQYNRLSYSWTMFNYVLKALIANRILYVHQLQNLYFALTGYELEPKS